MLIEIIKDKRYCPCFLLTAAINTMAAAHSWTKGFIFLIRPSHSAPVMEDRPTTQPRVEAEVLGNAAYSLLFSLFTHPRALCPGLSHQLGIKEMAQRQAHRPVWWRNFSCWGSLRVSPVSIKLANTQQHRRMWQGSGDTHRIYAQC